MYFCAGFIGDRNLILRENIHACDITSRGMDLLYEGDSDGEMYEFNYRDVLQLHSYSVLVIPIRIPIHSPRKLLTNGLHLIFPLQN